MFSIAILTLDEEQTLPGCLDSVAWCDDVLVFDSYSQDSTVAVAQARGARVIQHAFAGYASQRNACLELGEFKHDWVFMLDADERFTPQLRDEILAALAQAPPELCLLRLRRKDHFLGRWIPRAAIYPTWFGRLMRRGRVHVAREINEQYETDGLTGELREHLMHEPFARGLSHWIDRHNQYSTLEAQQRLVAAAQPLVAREMFSRDPTLRRAAHKRLAYRLPGRPLWVLLYLLFLRGAILEGYPGTAYSCLRAWYELAIDIKHVELRRAQAQKKP